MRIAHVTDIHVERLPSVGECLNKRAAGAVNLYVLGRASHFTVAAQEAMVAAVVAAEPDLVLCTGDLTATATEAEFAGAAVLLAPLRERFDWLVIPGNHDVYTGESVGRFSRHFGEVAPVRVARRGAWDIVLVDVCHPDWLSRGWLGEGGLAQLDATLKDGDRPALVAMHYPLRNRRGERYGPPTRACSDADAIEAICVRHPRVRMVCHGHEHHGFRTVAPRPGDDLPILDPGAGGYAWLPERGRTAHFCVYEIDDTALVGVERQAFDGQAFHPEKGGAFATGG